MTYFFKCNLNDFMNFSNQYLKRKSKENIVGVKIRLRAGSIPGKEKNIFLFLKV